MYIIELSDFPCFKHVFAQSVAAVKKNGPAAAVLKACVLRDSTALNAAVKLEGFDISATYEPSQATLLQILHMGDFSPMFLLASAPHLFTSLPDQVWFYHSRYIGY